MNNSTKVILVNVVVTVLLVFLIESASRLIRPIPMPDPLITDNVKGWSESREYDPLLFWKLKPHTKVGPHVVTNSLGLRGGEIPPKSPDEFRILSLGESTTFARRLQENISYSSHLERALDRVDGKRVRVINAGIPGYSLLQGVEYLRNRGLDLQPDAVMTYFGYNDLLPVAYRAKRDAGSNSEMAGFSDLELFEHRRSLVYRILYELQKRSNIARIFAVGSSTAGEEVKTGKKVRVPDADRRLLYSQLRELCIAERIRLVVLIPWYREFDNHIPLIRELKEWEDVVVVDLPALLPDPLESNHGLFFDKVHPSMAGHRLITKAIAEKLRDVWDIPAPETDDPHTLR